MTTTTGDPSILKTPATLSGGDLVSRLLAATPPYLYNVPLTPHSFFFSEMLRSFVQAKAEGVNIVTNPPGAPRRRKRSWRDTRDRPLELTTKDKNHHHLHNHHHHHPQQQQQHKDKYFQSQQQQSQQSQPEIHVENRFKSHNDATSYSTDIKNQHTASYEQKPSSIAGEPLKPVDDNRSDFCKQSSRGFLDDSSRLFSSEQSAQQEALYAAANQKVKPEEPQPGGDRKNCNYTEKSTFEERAKITNKELSFMDETNKLDFAGRHFLPGIASARVEEIQQAAKGFGINGNMTNSEFHSAGPLWYPPYPNIAQSYPAIDPLHFFIDLRVSGHIWDRKLNERQLLFKNKHCSAFSVPQAKEHNRPLNLTRDETATSSGSSSKNTGARNLQGTHSIFRNLCETYKDIREMEKIMKSTSSEDQRNDYQGRTLPKNDTTSRASSSREHQTEAGDEQTESKDLRALIGLELVVDCVKEPKKDPTTDEEQSPELGE